jgi:carbamoyl-phosphate synthase small subunit
MQQQSSPNAILLLEDGTTFKGSSFGATGIATGEICFNTGMTGYQEVFTDPSYTGQIIIMNAAHIGNYGTKALDVESGSVKVHGVIARNLEEQYFRPQANKNLQQYFVDENVVGIHQIDTRALVAHVRTKGAMNCVIGSGANIDVDTLKNKLSEMPNMAGLDLAKVVSTKEAYTFGGEGNTYKVAVLDYGVKRNILQCMVDRDMHVKVFPAQASFEDIASFAPNGYFISNGPGDPSAMPYAVELVKQILTTNKPVFGICLGHQLLALANGISTFKMHHGHRGLNHPVKNLISGLCEITTQNHGFGIVPEDVQKHPDVMITHINLNDNSIEGIKLKSKPAFSVQYHPESTPGPHDSRYLFDDFKALMVNA